MKTKLASLVLALVLAATACTTPGQTSSARQDLDGRFPVVNSTPTPTGILPPPLAFGLQLEETPVRRPYPTNTPRPLIDLDSDSNLFHWFALPDWHWFPLTLP
jgi:hypothetical protein